MASEIPYNFEYFERQDASPIENLIREHRHEIVSQEYIEKTLNQYDFGFARHNKKQVTSFVLCRLLPSSLFKNIDVVLVCSRTEGKHLLELVESHAKILSYQSLSLIAIGNRRLLNWYTSQGYIWETEKPILNSDSNAYSMRKYI